MHYFKVRKAKGNFLPLVRNILNFCSNLLVHALRDIIALLSEHLESQHSNLIVRKKGERPDFSNECIYLM
jgi:hypothetical protein